MKNYRLIVKNNLGTYRSSEFTDDSLGTLQNLLSKVAEMTYFKMDSDSGFIYFPKAVINQSVISIVEVFE